jgi:hypothetical protein
MAIPNSETDSTQTSPPVSIPPTISITVTPPATSTHFQNVHRHISEKLTQENYILRQFLMVPFLKGQNLFGYVDGTILHPPKLIPNSSPGLLITNPSHLSWYHQD